MVTGGIVKKVNHILDNLQSETLFVRKQFKVIADLKPAFAAETAEEPPYTRALDRVLYHRGRQRVESKKNLPRNSSRFQVGSRIQKVSMSEKEKNWYEYPDFAYY